MTAGVHSRGRALDRRAVTIAGIAFLVSVLMVPSHLGALAPGGAGTPAALAPRSDPTAAARATPLPSASQGTVNSSVTSTGTGGGWENVTGSSGTAPPARGYGRSMAYDPADHYVLMFGGYTGSYLSDTWTFANGTWKELHPSTSPSARDHGTLVWDPVDQYMLLFGGSGYGGAYNDTWKYVGGVWTHLHPSRAPSQRWASQMVWDTADRYALLFGGCSGSAVNDTWTFVGGNWTELTIAHAPPQLTDGSMSYDPLSGEVVLFGGQIDWGTATSDQTWVYREGSWTELTNAVHPPARYEASMAFDSSLGAVVLFGGSGTSGTYLSDTWWFRSGTWTEVVPLVTPPGRSFGIMADDPLNSELLLFSGYTDIGNPSDTWVYYTLTVSASVDNIVGVAPLEVGFHGGAIGGVGPLAYTWQFGDGNSTVANATSYLYSSAGTYYGSVTVLDANGVEATGTFGVHAIPPLAATGVVAPLGGTAPLTIAYSALPVGGVPPYFARWSANGTVFSEAMNGTYTFAAPGNYSVGMRITDLAGDLQSESFTVRVAPTPIPTLQAFLSYGPGTGVVPLNVSFFTSVAGGVPAYRYAWQFGDGSTSALADPVHAYLAAGSFTGSVTVIDQRGVQVSDPFAVNTSAALWAVGSAAPTATDVRAPVSFLGEAGGGLAPYLFSWTFGDGGSAGTANATHAYAKPGTYLARLTVVDGSGHRVVESVNLTIAPGPTGPPGPGSGGASATGGSAAGWAAYSVLGAEVAAGLVAAAGLLILFGRRPPAAPRARAPPERGATSAGDDRL